MSRKRLKQYLLLLLAIGVIAVAMSGGGTFAGFTAETANNGNTFLTGTLFLHNKVGGGTVCKSETGAGNVNSGCDILFTVPSVTADGSTIYSAHLALSNAGSLEASGISFSSPAGCTDTVPTITTLSTSAAQSATSVTVNALPQALLTGTPIKINGDSYTVASPGAASGATSIPITPGVIPGGGYSSGATVKIDSSGIGAASLCANLEYNIVETDSSFGTTEGCAYGPAGCDLADTAKFNSSYTLGGIPADALPTSPTALTLKSGYNGNSTTHLSAGQTRYFVIQVFAPASLSNAAQNDLATFGLTWDISQA